MTEDEIRRAIERVVADLRAGGFAIDDDEAAAEVAQTVDDIEHSPMLAPVRAFLRSHPQSARLVHEMVTVTVMSDLLLRDIRTLRSPRPRS